MSFSLLLIAFSLGLAGSFHCLGMCGPLLLSLNMSWKNRKSLLKQTLVHHFGRISSYLVMGFIVGKAGELIIKVGVQQKLSIISGVILIFVIIFQSSKKDNIWSKKLKTFWGRYFGQIGLKNNYLLGVVNGLLPCGLVFTALATAASTSSSIHSAIFMVIFGLGTLPLLLLISFGSLKMNILRNSKTKFILPTATILTACLLILRGLNLGIPYLSPEVKTQNEQTSLSCCGEKN